MEINDNLKAISHTGAGVNNIPLDKMSDRGVVVLNVPGTNANAAHALGMNVIGFDPSTTIKSTWQLSAGVE